MLQEIRTTFYGGEALPLFFHNWSAGNALVMGCEPRFAPDAVGLFFVRSLALYRLM
jgi:hypothetical protein